MKIEGSLELAVCYIHNPDACRRHAGKKVLSLFPEILIIDSTRYYEEKRELIENLILIDSVSEVIQVIAQGKPLNLLELKKILGYSYGTIHKIIHDLKNVKIIELMKSKSKKGRREMQIKLHPNVKITNLSTKEKRIMDLIDSNIKDSEKEHNNFKEWLSKRLEQVPKEPTSKISTK